MEGDGYVPPVPKQNLAETSNGLAGLGYLVGAPTRASRSAPVLAHVPAAVETPRRLTLGEALAELGASDVRLKRQEQPEQQNVGEDVDELPVTMDVDEGILGLQFLPQVLRNLRC